MKYKNENNKKKLVRTLRVKLQADSAINSKNNNRWGGM
jgi:hypothetical protein